MLLVSRAVLTLSGLALAAAGCSASPFACEQDEACIGPEGTGVCEPSGFCSFPDSECPSGRRYGAHAAGSLAGACTALPEASDGTGSPSPAPGEGSDSGTGSTTTTGLEPDGSSSTATSADPSDASTTDPDTSDEDSGDTSTGATVPSCVFDDFEDGRLDPGWSIWELGDVLQPLEAQGTLVLRLPATSDGWIGVSRPVGPLQDASITVEIDRFPVPSDAFAWFHVSDGLKYEFVLWDSTLQAKTGEEDNMTTQASVPLDTSAHRFLRFVGGVDEIVWLTSSDGENWTEFYSHPASPANDYTVDLGLGTWLPVDPGAEIRYAGVDGCPATR